MLKSTVPVPGPYVGHPVDLQPANWALFYKNAMKVILQLLFQLDLLVLGLDMYPYLGEMMAGAIF